MVPAKSGPRHPDFPLGLRSSPPSTRHSKTRWPPPTQGSNHRVVVLPFGAVPDDGFEPTKAEPADLQSAPFGRSGNLACTIRCAGNSTTSSPNLCKSPVQAARAVTPLATPAAPRRSPSGGAVPVLPDSRAAWPAPLRRTGGSGAQPQKTSHGLRSHG